MHCTLTHKQLVQEPNLDFRKTTYCGQGPQLSNIWVDTVPDGGI
jgi:hypothetical protein